MESRRRLSLLLFTSLGMVFIGYLLLDAIIQGLILLGVPIMIHPKHEHFGNWTLVALYTGVLIFFTLAYAAPKGGQDWRSMGVLQGFIVALYFEMYGFPLTIYALSALVGRHLAPTHANGHLLARVLGPILPFSKAGPLVMLVSSILMLAAFLLVFAGWRAIHRAGGALVTDGVYRHIRHPQYSGFFLITVALLIHWPTVITILMWPVLIYTYVRLAAREEEFMRGGFGPVYDDYALKTPRFFPSL